MENCKELYKEGTPEYDACVEKNKSEKNTEEKSSLQFSINKI